MVRSRLTRLVNNQDGGALDLLGQRSRESPAQRPDLHTRHLLVWLPVSNINLTGEEKNRQYSLVSVHLNGENPLIIIDSAGENTINKYFVV